MPIIDFDGLRSVSEYRNTLKGCKKASLKKFQSFLDLIAEEIDLTPSEFFHDPIFIAVSKFVERGLALSDAWSIQYMFSEDWSVLPWRQPLHKKEIVDGLSVRLEDDADEPTFKNRSNFTMALAEAIASEASEVLPFEIAEVGSRYPSNKKEKPSATTHQDKPVVRKKALELIARKIGDSGTFHNIELFLKNCGVDHTLIVPNTKWRMVFDVMVGLANSHNPKDIDTLCKIIGEATHPLGLHDGNEASASILRTQFDEYLKYDNGHIGFDEREKVYKVFFVPSDMEQAEILAEIREADVSAMEEEQKKELEFLCRPENREKISSLKKTYQLLMSVVEAFCENPGDPTSELNSAYLTLNGSVWKTISDLGLREQKDIYDFSIYASSFTNLFAAEKHYQEQKKELSWQTIRPEMNAMYGDIEELYRKVSGSDILAEPDQQKQLNDIQLYLSNLKKKREMAKKMVHHQPQQRVETQSAPVTKIEITSWPEMQAKKAEEKSTFENSLKSIYLIGDLAEPYKLISLVLDGNFKHPIRFAVKNKQKKETSIKKLYDIAYPHNVPGKIIYYDENLANSINNDLFTKKKEVADYMKSNNLRKPQLVMKSPGGTLILKGDVSVETMRPAQVQAQYRSLYEAKK